MVTPCYIKDNFKIISPVFYMKLNIFWYASCIHIFTTTCREILYIKTSAGRQRFDSNRAPLVVVTLIRPPESGPNSVIFLNILRFQNTYAGPEIYPTGLFLFRSLSKNIKERPLGLSFLCSISFQSVGTNGSKCTVVKCTEQKIQIKWFRHMWKKSSLQSRFS